MDIISKIFYGTLLFIPAVGAIMIVSIFIEIGLFKMKFNENTADGLISNMVPSIVGAAIIAYILVNIFL